MILRRVSPSASQPRDPSSLPQWRERLPRWVARAVALSFVALAAIGAIREFAPVPHFDRWEVIVFFSELERLDPLHGWLSAWRLHNEHRLVVPRLFFWIDCHFFACRQTFLLGANIALMGATWLLFYGIARRLMRDGRLAVPPHLLAMLLAVMCFSWLQKDNFVAGFQISFICAYLLPLAAFTALALSATEGAKSTAWFAVAIVLGVASAGTLANGIATLPLLAAMALALRQSPWRVAALAVAAIVVGGGYFVGYENPPNHSPVAWTLLTQPFRSAKFWLALLGSPLALDSGSVIAGAMGGVAVLALWLVAVLRWRRERAPAELALIAFLAYVIVSALATAGGRMNFGVEYALASRYTTPALFGFSAALLLALSMWRGYRWTPRAFVTLAVVATVALSVVQLTALEPSARLVRFGRMVSALSLELAVHDLPAAQVLYPTAEVYEWVERARSRGWAGFGDPPLVGLRASLGRPADELNLHRCDARIDSRVPVPGNPTTTRLYGAVRDPTTSMAPDRVFFVSPANRVVGAGVVAQPRIDWHGRLGRPAQSWLFGAYVVDAAVDDAQAYCP